MQYNAFRENAAMLRYPVVNYHEVPRTNVGLSAEIGPSGNQLQINPTKLQKAVPSSSGTPAPSSGVLWGGGVGAPTVGPPLPPAQVGLPLPLLTGPDGQSQPEML